MALLSDKEIKEVIDQAKNMKFKESRRQVSYWLLRGLCAFIGAAFWLLCLLLLVGGNIAWIIFLLLGFCWMAASLVFHLSWLRYAEASVLKSLCGGGGELDDGASSRKNS